MDRKIGLNGEAKIFERKIFTSQDLMSNEKADEILKHVIKFLGSLNNHKRLVAHDLEDIAHTVYAKAIENISQVKNIDNILPWLNSMARNYLYDLLRRKGNQATEEVSEITQKRGKPETTALDEMLSEEKFKILEKILSNLPPKSAKIWKMRRLEGLDYDQISKKTGLSNQAVRSAVNRIQRALTSEFKQYNL